jgi:hypothetical protein
MMHKGRGVAAETWIVVRLAGASPRTQKVRLWSLITCGTGTGSARGSWESTASPGRSWSP